MYLIIFKLYLVDLTRGLSKPVTHTHWNPYPHVRVWVPAGTGTGLAGDTRGLPVPFTTWVHTHSRSELPTCRLKVADVEVYWPVYVYVWPLPSNQDSETTADRTSRTAPNTWHLVAHSDTLSTVRSRPFRTGVWTKPHPQVLGSVLCESGPNLYLQVQGPGVSEPNLRVKPGLDLSGLVIESPVRSGYLMPGGPNQDPNWLGLWSKPKLT